MAADQQVAELKTLYPPGEALVLTGSGGARGDVQETRRGFQTSPFRYPRCHQRSLAALFLPPSLAGEPFT